MTKETVFTEEQIKGFSSKEILQMGLKTKRLERIPISSILNESGLIDQTHAQHLAKSMMGQRDQISPATVRARISGEDVVHDVIDGFHRNAAKHIIEATTLEPQFLDTVTLYGCSDEELFDLRVLAANSVRSIKFARMAEWMRQSFLSTTWNNERIGKLAKENRLALSQIFGLAHFDTSGTKVGLNSKEVAEVREWALRKSSEWNKSVSTLMIEMKTVEQSAPELVQMVRVGAGGGQEGKATFTQIKLRAISSNIPGEWDLQREFADMSVKKNILAQDLNLLVKTYVKAREMKDKHTMDLVMSNPLEILNSDERDSIERKVGVAVKKQVVVYEAEKPETIATTNTNESANDSEEVNFSKKVTKMLYDKVLSSLPENSTILYLPTDNITLNKGNSMVYCGERSILLTDEEKNVMLCLYIMEGISLNDKHLKFLTAGEIKTTMKRVVISLKEKLASVSKGVSDEMFIVRGGKYIWGGQD